MPNNYRGFIKKYDKPTEKLTSYVNVFPVFSSNRTLCNVPIKLKALWDTGATVTAIRPETLNQLKSPLVNTGSSKKLAGIGGTVIEADYTLTNIYLTDNFFIEYCPTYVMDFPLNFDIIIGMDIIGMGDFAVCNIGNTTSFTFAIPPFPDRLDFAEKADTFNGNNNFFN